MIGTLKRNLSLILLLVLASLPGSANGEADPRFGEAPSKILLLPFDVAEARDQQKELEDFSSHVDKTLRQTLTQLGENIRLESQEEVRKLLGGRSAPMTESEAVRIASESGADLVIFGLLSREEQGYRMKGEMWDLRRNRVSVSSDLKVANIHALPGALDIFVSYVGKRIHGSPRLPLYKAEPLVTTENRPPSKLHTRVNLPRNTGPWTSPEIPAALRALDVGDIDGDKKNETLFVDENSVTISRFEDGGLRTLAQFSEPPAGYFSVEAVDVDGDGISEVILCYRLAQGIESAIIRYVNRNLTVVGRFPNVILATIPDPADPKKKILVGQRTDVKDMFTGEMIRYRVQGSQVTEAGNVVLPPGTLLLSYASGRLGKSAVSVQIILNQDRRLMVFDRDNRLLTTSADRVFGLERSVRIPHKEGSRDIAMPGRLLITDTNSDGEHEVLAIKQTSSGSSVEALVWDGSRLQVKWRTVNTPAVISDFRIGDFKNGGVRSLVLLLIKSNPLAALTGGVRSSVFAYDLLP